MSSRKSFSTFALTRCCEIDSMKRGREFQSELTSRSPKGTRSSVLVCSRVRYDVRRFETNALRIRIRGAKARFWKLRSRARVQARVQAANRTRERESGAKVSTGNVRGSFWLVKASPVRMRFSSLRGGCAETRRVVERQNGFEHARQTTQSLPK